MSVHNLFRTFSLVKSLLGGTTEKILDVGDFGLLSTLAWKPKKTLQYLARKSDSCVVVNFGKHFMSNNYTNFFAKTWLSFKINRLKS
jgi:hypothetical protein